MPLEKGNCVSYGSNTKVNPVQETTFMQAEGNFSDSSKLGRNLIGLCAYRTPAINDGYTSEDPTHFLNSYTGGIRQWVKGDINPEVEIPVKIVDFQWTTENDLRFTAEYNGKQFHKNEKRKIDFKEDPGTGTDHTSAIFPQFTDMETRGNDAFALAINTLTAEQDIDLDSRPRIKVEKA